MNAPTQRWAHRVGSLLWSDPKRRALTVTGGLIMASNLLFLLWVPFRVAALQTVLMLGGGRLFIGLEYSALDSPRFVPLGAVASTDSVSSDTEVIGVELNGVAKAIPVKRIAWHMVLNVEIGSEPVLVTLCTIADAAMAYRARCRARTLTFRPIGLARNNLVMLDNETQSRWQQFTGRAVSGPLTGAELDRIPVERVTLAAWRQRHPRGGILEPLGTAQDQSTPHDTCPVMYYFASESFLLQKPESSEDGRLPRKQTVIGMVMPNGVDVACTPEAADALPEGPALLKVKCYWFAWAEFHPGSRLNVAGNAPGL